jgi:hypothetical protein
MTNPWYELGESDELQEAYDSYKPLPDDDEALNAFVESKHINIAALLRMGARLSAPTVIAFPYERGIKYRDIVTGRRWAYHDSTFKRLKRVAQDATRTQACIIAEGETDAAWLALHYPACDVLVMPAGALRWTDAFTEQANEYDVAYVALDTDETGERGAGLVLDAIDNGVRLRPDGKDWCEADKIVPLPTPEPKAPDVVFGRLEGQVVIPEIRSWFSSAILPIGGLLIVHGREKSFKSWAALDMAKSLAVGQAWCGFEMEREPGKVGVVQFEIPLGYYSDRVELLYATLPTETAKVNFGHNFGTVTPVPGIRFNVQKESDKTKLTKILVDNGIEILLFDPIRRAMRGANMNVEHELDQMLGYFEELNHLGITVIACHHDNKGNRRGGDPLDMTGSSRFAGDPDTIISIELPKNKRVEHLERNVFFLTRNAASPPPKSFSMDRDTGLLVYNDGLWGEDNDDDLPGI